MTRGARLAALLALTCAASASRALTIEYALDRPAALVACDERMYRGARTEADTCYRKLLAENPDSRIKADAARALGDVREANSRFQAAIKEYPDDAALRTRWGELFIATHQNNEAIRLFQEALELDADYAPAKIGLAKVAAGQFEEKTREWARQVIEESPDDALGAYLLLARAALEDGALDDGDDALDAALELAEDNDRSPLEAYALKASLDLLRNTTESPWTARALALNPSYGGVYTTPAHFYVITRRYREAIALLRKAVEIEPDLYSAHAELGLNLLRENKIEEARRHLEIAYGGDPFSAPIVNTLRLVDSFDNFVVSQHPARPAAAGSNAAHNPGSILRLHKDEAAVLEPYVLDVVNRTIDIYTKRYGFELKEPVIVELYPDHDDFAVRIAGLPGIGLLGVTFGYLVAMDSPTGRADASFHWGTTLWHEMAHVFTLEATNHLVPRWFSEGVSVFEEWSTGPLPGRHIPVPVLEAIKADKFLPIADL
ncbi:MAG TPA: tetratricopeptide repeat protein, partial [Gammaproteobacteria bacterium]